MSEPMPDPKARVSLLVEELETAVYTLDAEAALAVRADLTRISEAIVGRTIGEALTAARKPAAPVRLTLEEAAMRMGKSTWWLYHNRKHLGMGFTTGGSCHFFESDV